MPMARLCHCQWTLFAYVVCRDKLNHLAGDPANNRACV